MKQLFLFLLLIISLNVRAQFPSNPTSGNVNWNSHNVGATTGDLGICAGVRTDTTAWNLVNYVKTVPYIIVNTTSPDASWRRNASATGWDRIAKYTDINPGTVTSVSGLSPLFTVSNPTTTPTFAQISQSQNLVFASPNGSSGNPSFRALVAADLPAGTIVTASNGLTKVGNDIQLGGTLTEAVTTINADGNVFEVKGLSALGASIYMDNHNLDLFSSRLDASHQTGIRIFPDSISIEPYLGDVRIDTLNNETAQDRLVGWISSGAGRGKLGNVTLGSGISLSSGVLSATGASQFYSWQDYFDDAVIGANQTDGINKTFTLSQTPLRGINVFKNGQTMAEGLNYTLSGTTLTFIDSVFKKDTIRVNYSYSSAQTPTTRYDQNQTNNVVMYGNSLISGSGAVPGFSDVVSQSKNFLPTVGFNLVNRGVGGATSVQLNTWVNDSLAPYLSTSYGSNIVVVYEGSNDLAAGSSAPLAYTHIKTLCNTIKALNAAYKVIICTVLPGNPYVDEAKRVQLNDSIVTNYASFADGLTNFSTNSIIGDPGDNGNKNYYLIDSLHLWPEGYYQMAKTIYPSVMAQAGIATQSITNVLLPTENPVVQVGGNMNLSTDTSFSIGTNRYHPFYFRTSTLNRGNISSAGNWTINPSINTTSTATTNGIDLSASITGNNSGAVYNTVKIQGGFSNGLGHTENQLKIISTGGTDIFTVGNQAAATSLFPITAPSSNISSAAFKLSSDLSLANFTTGGIEFNSGGTSGTSNANVIGINSTTLIYNTANANSHSFRNQNTERFAVGFNNQIYGGYGANLSVTGQADLDGTTTSGLVFTSPGGQPTQINRGSANQYQLIYQTRSTGNHTFAVGTSAIVTIGSTAKLLLAAGSATASTAPLKFTSGTNLSSAESGAMEWDGTNLFMTQATGPTRKTIAYTTDIPAATTPLGNYGNVQINRNSVFATPSSDSLNFTAGTGLSVKGSVAATLNVTVGTGAFMGINSNNSTFYSTTDQGFRASGNAYIVSNTDNSGGGNTIIGDGSAAFGSINTRLTISSTAVTSTVPVSVTGNLTLAAAGNKINITTGSNASAGTATFSSGTVTINTTAVTANSLIFVTATSCTNCANIYIGTITAGTSFVVNSGSGTDGSSFNWLIIN